VSDTAPPTEWPTVSVVVPVRNEAVNLRAAVESILTQTYPGGFDVCLAIAPCTDDTMAVAEAIVADHPQVHIVDNPGVTPPCGQNAGFRATTGEVVVVVGGHSALCPGYIGRAVATMLATGAVNVGGVQRAEGTTTFQRAVARAMTSRFGVGSGRTHLGGTPGPVDSVSLGVFRRTAVEAVGMFDESLRANEDYELNIRLRAAGGVVWFDPELWATYRPRTSVRRLARQYFDYGRYKRRVVLRYPASLRWRQTIPPLATATLIATAVLGWWWRPAWLVPTLYLGLVLCVSIIEARSPGPDGQRVSAARLTLIYPTMHLCWGGGFLFGRLPA
jgi:glycosyltransferase involved in cell wall biosynthesis